MGLRFTYTPPARNALPIVAAAAEVAAGAAAEHILEASRSGVPVEEGVLKASGRVAHDGHEAAISYGRDDDGTDKHAPSNQYAVKQHEDLSLHHPNGGHGKWLELAMNGEGEAVVEIIAATVRRAVES